METRKNGLMLDDATLTRTLRMAAMPEAWPWPESEKNLNGSPRNWSEIRDTVMDLLPADDPC